MYKVTRIIGVSSRKETASSSLSRRLRVHTTLFNWWVIILMVQNIFLNLPWICTSERANYQWFPTDQSEPLSSDQFIFLLVRSTQIFLFIINAYFFHSNLSYLTLDDVNKTNQSQGMTSSGSAQQMLPQILSIWSTWIVAARCSVMLVE